MRSIAVLTLALALAVPAQARVKAKAKKAAAAAPAEDDLEAKKEKRAQEAFDAAATRPEEPAEEASPAAAEAPVAAPGEDPAADAAAVAQMLALSSGQAPVSSGPPAALAKKLVPVLVALNLQTKIQPPIKMQELQYFGAADIDGNGVSELILSWARNQDMGGVALATKTETGHKIVAIADVREPVLRVQAIPLAGNKSRHLLIRSGTSIAEGGTTRRMAVWGVVGGKLSKIWEQRDVDRIENNGDISSDREAQLSDVTFKDGKNGEPGSLTVAVTEYRAPKGKGPEATETRGARTLHYVFDKKRGVLVLKSKQEASAEQLKKDELGMAGPGASGVVPGDQGEERVARTRGDADVPVSQVDHSQEEVVNATGLRAREQMSRIDLPASPARRMLRLDEARRKRSDENKKRQQRMEEAAQQAEEEAAEETEEKPAAGEESGPRPKGVEAVDGAK